MNGLELNKTNQSIIKVLKRILKDNLFAVISVGSVAWGNYIKSWSDVDILIVVENTDLTTKQKVAQAKELLEKQYKSHFGINIINKKEFQRPFLPAISLEGKTLQALLELKIFPDRMIFCKEKIIKFYSPTKKDIKNYSLSNIAMFLLRNRRTLSSKNTKEFKEYKSIVEKEMRACFIMVKLSIQYFTFYICVNNKETIQKAEKLFPNFDFQTLKINLQNIEEWDKINKRSQLESLLKLNDLFIENFNYYVFEKTKK